SSSAATWTSPISTAPEPACCRQRRGPISRGRWPSWRRSWPSSGAPRRCPSNRPPVRPSAHPPGCSRRGGKPCGATDERYRSDHVHGGGGDGVGRLDDGRAVFVPRTAPGERVRLRDGIKLLKNFARGELAEVVVPAGGGARVTPPCPHYPQDRCGGCQLQHVPYDAQPQAKRAIVGDALPRIAKLDVPDPEIVEAVEEWRYRAKVSLAVRRGKGRGKAVGLHPYDRPGTVFPLTDCHIAGFR